MSALVDAHCHVMELADPQTTVRRAMDSGVVIIGVTNHPQEFEAAKRRFAAARNVRLAAGLHPLLASQLTTRDVAAFGRVAETADYIGEVGLDFSREGVASRNRQQALLDEILANERLSGKVWSFHSRRADEEVIVRVERSTIRLTPVLHWFTGPVSLIDRAVAAGCYFSVNERMLTSSKAPSLFAGLPRERVLTETDAPYGRRAGRTSSPADIAAVVHRLASVWGMTPAETREQVFANMAAAFAGAGAETADGG